MRSKEDVQNESIGASATGSDQRNSSENAKGTSTGAVKWVGRAKRPRLVRHQRGRFSCDLKQFTPHFVQLGHLPDDLYFGLLAARADLHGGPVPELDWPGYIRTRVSFTPLNRYFFFCNEVVAFDVEARWHERPSHGALFDAAGTLLAQGTLSGSYYDPQPETHFSFGEHGLVLSRPKFLTEDDYPATHQAPSRMKPPTS